MSLAKLMGKVFGGDAAIPAGEVHVIVHLKDAKVEYKLKGGNAKHAAQSLRRKFAAEGLVHNGTHYGPAGIVKIEIREPSNGG